MVSRPIPLRNPAGHVGLLPTLRSLVASLAQFLESRLQLAARESKAAARHLLMLAAFCIAAAVLSIFGFVFLIVSIIFSIAHFFGISWTWVALGAALIHFLVAICFVIFARQQVKHPILRETANVLKEDTEWLKNLDQTKPL
jgi:uncharacterized membrane protein YqjE